MSQRARNPRVVAVEQLRDMRKMIDQVKLRWTVTKMIYIPQDDRDPEDPGRWERSRRPDEYPEVQPQAWCDLAHQMARLATWANAMRDFALRQEDRARREIGNRSSQKRETSG